MVYPVSALPGGGTGGTPVQESTSRSMWSYHRRSRGAAAMLAFVYGLVARQIVGVVRVVAVRGPAGHVVQHCAEQPDRQAVEHLEFGAGDVAVAVPCAQHEIGRAHV